jgi:Protein of unknown function (DUF3102)
MSDLANNPTITPSTTLRRPEPTPKAETSTPAPTEPTLDDLARKIKLEHQEITRAKKNIVERAMQIGDWLSEAKNRAGHGNWLKWLGNNCQGISERTANIYMKLAEGREKLKSAETADFTINEALRRLADDGSTGTGTGGNGNSGGAGGNPSDKIDRITDRLLKLLKELNDADKRETAEAAVANVMKRLKDAGFIEDRRKAA